jgi:hypothetical protein
MYYFAFLMFGFLVSIAMVTGSARAKPHVWVYTDMSDPRDQRAGGHPQNDPDDICSLAALLLEANRFQIEAVVYSSTNRRNLADATDFVHSTFAEAYAHDLPFLNETIGGFQPEITFLRSSITGGPAPRKFDPERDYSDLSGLETVQGLVEFARHQTVYVLSWGPLTESAMAAKHCLDTGNLAALENMVFISHWTKSWIAQGTPENPFRVANCRDDAKACHFLHELAVTHPVVRIVELGSVGQTGLVNGSSGYPKFTEFRKSRLGQIFIHSKFYHGKPDQSDGSTFWLLAEAFGPTLADYPHDGSLDRSAEERGRDLFLANGHAILDDLLLRSNAAAEAANPFPESFITDRFTYVYQFLDGRYSIHVPYDARYGIQDAAGDLVMSGSVGPGNHPLDLDALAPGHYAVRVEFWESVRHFTLTKPE